MQELTLRDYQQRGIDLAREAMRQYKRIVYYLPTGGGKTEVAVALIKLTVQNNKKVAFICNRTQLINQTIRKFEQRGIHCGVIQADNTRSVWSSVLVCSIQSIRSRGMPPVDLIIVDECHQCAGTKQFIELFKGVRVIGLTATPYQKGLGRRVKELDGPIFEHICVSATMKELVGAGWLVPYEAYGPPIDLSKVKVVKGEYEENSLAETLDKQALIGDVITQWLKLAAGKKTMVFAVNIAHSKNICESFRNIGVNAVHVDYTMKIEEKEAIYKRFRETDEITVICNPCLLREGADFPDAECLILAKSTKSPVVFTQMVGRVLRPADGKAKAIILDHGSVFANLGRPEDFDVSTLDDGKPKKSTGKPQEKKEPLPKPCPACHFLKPPGVHECPSCGFRPERRSEVEHTNHDLELIGGKKKVKLSTTISSMPKQDIYSQLLSFANNRGYKQGWVNHKYKTIYGVWPRGMQEIRSEPQPELLAWLRQQQIAWAKSQGR